MQATVSRPELQLRIAEQSDGAILERLVADAYRGGRATVSWKNEDHLVKGPRTSSDELSNMITSPDSRILVLETSAGDVVGCVLVENHHEGDVHIGLLTVNPDFQNLGVGGLLLAEAEAFARTEFRSTGAVMWVLSHRDELLGWYQSKGYSLTGQTEPFPGDETGLVQLEQGLHFRVIRKSLV